MEDTLIQIAQGFAFKRELRIAERLGSGIHGWAWLFGLIGDVLISNSVVIAGGNRAET